MASRRAVLLLFVAAMLWFPVWEAVVGDGDYFDILAAFIGGFFMWGLMLLIAAVMTDLRARRRA